MSIHSEAQLDQRFIAFARLLNTYLQHFPKHEKYGLALHISEFRSICHGHLAKHHAAINSPIA